MLTRGHKINCHELSLARQWCHGGGVGSFLTPQSLMLDQGHSTLLPSSPGPHWHLAAVCWQDWRGQQGDFKLSGQNVKFTQQREGEEAREGTPHARVLSICPAPPSSPNLLFSPRPKQAQVPRFGGKAVLTLRKVREPSQLETGSPKAGPETSIRGYCPAWSPTPHLRSLALGQKNWVS